MTKTLDKKLKVTHSTRRLDDLKPTEYNPRKISDKAKKKLRKSLLDFGYIDPIIINTFKSRENIIISGHQRYYIMKEDLVEEVDVIEVSVDPNKEKLLNIAMNNKNLMGDWDDEKLTNVLGELFKSNQDLSLAGFDELELDKILEPLGLFDNEKDDMIPEVPDETVSKTGDLYLLGRHRLLCGDSTKKEDVMKLMSHEKADMVFTDPPYNLGYTIDIDPEYRKNWDKFKNDKMNKEEWNSFTTNFIKNCYEYTKIPSPAYIWIDWRQFQYIREKMQQYFPVKACIVWAKIGGSPPWLGGDYKCTHEFCLYGKNGNNVLFNGKHIESDVWIQKKDFTGKYKHPTQKPVELSEKAIKNSSQKNNIILDLFGGSGSTLIACEKTNRICYMMEIDPHYCDVIVKRWEDYTGLKAKLVKTNA